MCVSVCEREMSVHTSLSSLLCLDSFLDSFLCPHFFYFSLYPVFYFGLLYLSAHLFWTDLLISVNICLSFPGRPCQTPKEEEMEKRKEILS